MSELLGASGTGLPADLCLSCLAVASRLSAGNWQTNEQDHNMYRHGRRLYNNSKIAGLTANYLSHIPAVLMCISMNRVN